MAEDRLWEEPPQVKFRPSYSATSLNCPGSLLPSLDAPDSAGLEAAIGTVFHQIIAEWQVLGFAPEHRMGQAISVGDYTVVVDNEMFVHAEACINRYDHILGERFVETRVDISELTPIPDQSGTADLTIVSPGVLDIIDWKYGKGVKVFVKDNTQLLCYGFGAFRQHDIAYDIQRIRLHVAQPRLDHFEVWEITRSDLLDWALWARDRWRRAWEGDATRTPSQKACQWCRVRVGCPARLALLAEIVDGEFEASYPPEAQQDAAALTALALPKPVQELSTERLAWVLQYRQTIEHWFKEVADELIRRDAQGEALGGLWKVVTGRQGNRAWIDEQVAGAALERLGIDPWKTSLLSPAEIERRLATVGVRKKLAAEYLSLYTGRAPGKPTLVPTEDNRLSKGDEIDNLLTE